MHILLIVFAILFSYSGMRFWSSKVKRKNLQEKETSFIIVYVLIYGTVYVVWVENK